MVRVEARGLVFGVDTGGPTDGEPVVLLHGFPQNRTMWHQVGERLHGAGLRTIAPDQRGYSPGARPKAGGSYTIRECARDVIAIMDALDIPSAHVIAHDWGAMAAWVAAHDSPERIRSLTAVSVPHPGAYAAELHSGVEQRVRSSYMLLFRLPVVAEALLGGAGGVGLRAVFAGSGLSRREVSAYVDPLLEPGALTGALAWYRAMSLDRVGRLGPVSCPVTYIWGSRDPAVTRGAALRCGAHVTGPYEFVEVPGASHWLPDRAPDEVAAAALRLIASAGRSA